MSIGIVGAALVGMFVGIAVAMLGVAWVLYIIGPEEGDEEEES